MKDTDSSMTLIDKVNHFIHDNIDRSDLVVADIARGVYKSERQLFRSIKELTGMTPYRYLQHIRMEQSYQMIKNRKYRSLKKVASAVGYGRTDHFIRLFREKFGQHPKDILINQVDNQYN